MNIISKKQLKTCIKPSQPPPQPNVMARVRYLLWCICFRSEGCGGCWCCTTYLSSFIRPDKRFMGIGFITCIARFMSCLICVLVGTEMDVFAAVGDTMQDGDALACQPNVMGILMIWWYYGDVGVIKSPVHWNVWEKICQCFFVEHALIPVSSVVQRWAA